MSAHASLNGPEWTPSSIWVGAGYLDFHNPDPAVLSLPVIARCLAREHRWSGVTERPYTVAEHSAAVLAVALTFAPSDTPRTALARHALTHDFPEFAFRDFAHPYNGQCPEYCDGHDRLAAAIDDRFRVFDGVSWLDRGKIRRIVKNADGRVGATEKEILLPDAPPWATADPHPLGIVETADPEALLFRLCAEWEIE